MPPSSKCGDFMSILRGRNESFFTLSPPGVQSPLLPLQATSMDGVCGPVPEHALSALVQAVLRLEYAGERAAADTAGSREG